MNYLNSSVQLGQTLASRRKALGIPQAVFATKLGISQQRFSELEVRPGTLTVDRLLTLLNLLNLELTIAERTTKGKTSKAEW
jgi:HTH-type transcriptional regulator / antitoxin HipB